MIRLRGARWRRSDSPRQLTPKISALCVLLATSGMLIAAWWFGLREPYLIMPVNLDGIVRMDEGTPSPPSGSLMLAPGEKLPSWDVKGWLNGTRPALGGRPGTLTVVDVWNEL